MEVEFRINGVITSLDVAANQSLLDALRREDYYSVRHGCETGECGACAVQIDGAPRLACVTFAAQVGGCTLTTLDGIGTVRALHPLQRAFINTGAAGCGFCASGMILAAYDLLQRNPDPGEEEVRDALSGVLCRCTGYVRPVQAVLRAAAEMRGGAAEAVESENAADVIKLVTGKAVFVDDVELRGMLHARLLTSPHAHAIIRDIDVVAARSLPGVLAVLTFRDLPRVPYASHESTTSESVPRDRYSLDYSVRYAGDRVAAVAAETAEIAEQALRLIQVTYEVLPAVFDPRKTIEPGAPRLHQETESTGIYDAARNIAAHFQADTGNIEGGFAEAEQVIEGDYIVPQVQRADIETHTTITYLDADERLVVRTNTASADAVRHIIAPLIDLPARRIRVIAPRSGGGVKEGILLEDICALLTLATRRPVRIEFSRAEEFRSSYASPAQSIHLKTGVRRDGVIVANQVTLLMSAGAYGSCAPALLHAAWQNALSLYPGPNTRYVADAIYTNLPPAGPATDAYGAIFALENHLDEVAKQAGIDALELRRRNWLRAGAEPLRECLRVVEEKLGWQEKRGKGATGRYRRGFGIALSMQDVAAGNGKSGASIKLNEDGSFTVLAGAMTAGNGSESVLAQMAAEALSVRPEDIVLRLADTDTAPFAGGASMAALLSTAASAVRKAAEQVRTQVLEVAGRMLQAEPRSLTLEDGLITALNGDTVTVAQVASRALYDELEAPIMAMAVETGSKMAPSFAAHGAEVEVDTETGAVRVLRVVSVIDTGRIINPLLAESRVAGDVTRVLGQSISEEMLYDEHGILLTTDLSDYRIYNALDMPHIEVEFIETSKQFEPGSFAALPTGGIVPAIANAVADALGVRIRQLPLTPERVMQAMRMQG